MTFLKLSLFLFLVGCAEWGRPILYSPNFFSHDYMTMTIVNAEGKTISCGDVEFNQLASLTKDKIKELAEIIRRARLPRESEKLRETILKELEKASK